MIQTYTGKPFNPLAGENEDCGPIELMDIAHALSHLCRFNGHTKRFYSVGEHSLYVSTLLEYHGPSIQAWGLLHDAAEAYLADLWLPPHQLHSRSVSRRSPRDTRRRSGERHRVADGPRRGRDLAGRTSEVRADPRA